MSKNEASLIKTIGILGLLALVLLTIGFVLFAAQSWLIALICIPFFTIVILYHLITFILMSLYPGFNTKEHKERVAAFRRAGHTPKVAVLIPAAGEAISIVEATTSAALKIRYPNFTVHVLDDSSGGIYRAMAKKLGAFYFRRRNTGMHKKAGNLNAAIAKLKGYDYTLVLDADFVPRKEIIEELMPYAAEDVGIVQSPQHFDLNDEVYRRSKFEFGAGLIQRDFYRITQVARNRFGGAICVGTNALYNITALKQVGGYEGVGRKEWGHSEDVHTGLKMINARNKRGARYKIKYVPIQLAKGSCPSTHLSFYKQQNRWATGSIQLAFSKKTLFSRELSLAQKLCYFSNSIYYLYTIGLLFTPLQLLILMLAGDQYEWGYTFLFLPMLFIVHVLTPFVTRRRAEPIATILVVISNAYTFAQALALLAIRRPLGWEATGASVAKKKSLHFTAFKLLGSGFFVTVYVITLAVLLLNQRIGFNPSTFIVSLFLLAFVGHLIYLYYMLIGGIKLQKLPLNRYFYAYICIVVATLSMSSVSLSYSDDYHVKLSKERFIAFETVRPQEAIAHPKPTIIEPVKQPASTPKVYTIAASSGETQSLLAAMLAQQIGNDKGLDLPTKGKLQDKLMHAMGYQNTLYGGTRYSFDESVVQHLMLNAYVYEHEVGFWSHYAELVGLK